jgi:DNA-binding Lrp family transcriptional regulator
LRHPNDNAADFLGRIVPFVKGDGARNLNQISRDLKIPYQTLRFRMLNLKKDGISVLAVPDLDKLGLERVRVSFRLPASIKDLKPFFRSLHERAGLRCYARSLFTHMFDCEFAVPQGNFSELQTFLEELEASKLIQEIKMRSLLWKDVSMLKTRFYDYSKKEWDVDFSTLTDDPSFQSPERSEKEYFDYSDLLMIKELELDPWIKTVDLAKRVYLGVPDAAYHLNKHVFGKKLIKTFRLRWEGTKEAWLKHSIVSQTYYFQKLPGDSVRHAMSILRSFPFTWSTMMAEDGTMVAEVIIPLSQYPEGMQYISSRLRALDLSPTQILDKDWSCCSTFTIPYLLYDKNKSTWDFDSQQALESTLLMIKTPT